MYACIVLHFFYDLLFLLWFEERWSRFDSAQHDCSELIFQHHLYDMIFYALYGLKKSVTLRLRSA